MMQASDMFAILSTDEFFEAWVELLQIFRSEEVVEQMNVTVSHDDDSSMAVSVHLFGLVTNRNL